MAAGSGHTVLLRSDGTAVACGSNVYGQCTLPASGEGTTYTQVAADCDSVLLRSNGTAVACGSNSYGQCTLPALGEGTTYIQVAAGTYHTVLLRSDGTAVACGSNSSGQCTLPALGEGITYTQSVPIQSLEKIVLQASFDGTWMLFATLSGAEHCRIEAKPTDRLADIFLALTTEIGSRPSMVDVVLPAGEVLRNMLSREPSATIAGYCIAASAGERESKRRRLASKTRLL